MVYDLIIADRARTSLKRMSPDVARRVIAKIERLQVDLADDVKRLVNFEPAYRLRVGDWRVLFELHGGKIVVHDVKHRSQVYDS